MVKYTEIAQKNDLLFLDYSTDDLSFKKEFFYNANHLNKKGTDIFTKKLVKDLKRHYQVVQ